AEFRIITSNFDAEYGEFSGGQINVVTKSGTNAFHGYLFEFLRNTNLDARNFFSPTRGTFDQNQFGGTIGGPIKKNQIFFFGDYQGTRTDEGLDTGQVSVPTLAERGGNFADTAIPATSGGQAVPPFSTVQNGVVTPEVVQGAGLAAQLQNSLNYATPVFSGEPYFKPGCN